PKPEWVEDKSQWPQFHFPRTNVLHLPVRGSGDGGVVTWTGDLVKFWRALMGGKLVSPATLDALTTAVSDIEDENATYGHGFYRNKATGYLYLDGWDAGISARTWYDPATGVVASVLSNSSEGAGEALGAVDWAGLHLFSSPVRRPNESWCHL
ncbi:MAG: beta-lactamase family protein, partial [Promicromonosporaceae bacterium]|nr:beta-lactamase family protein [Promicromonosporaceae bacterium]